MTPFTWRNDSVLVGPRSRPSCTGQLSSVVPPKAPAVTVGSSQHEPAAGTSRLVDITAGIHDPSRYYTMYTLIESCSEPSFASVLGSGASRRRWRDLGAASYSHSPQQVAVTGCRRGAPASAAHSAASTSAGDGSSHSLTAPPRHRQLTAPPGIGSSPRRPGIGS